VKAKYIVQQWLDDTHRTKTAFAAELGIQPTALSMMLSGQRRMSLAVALKASAISGLAVEVFGRLRTERREQGQEQVA
jgi:plasmid maintenance system antidote protein VapI